MVQKLRSSWVWLEGCDILLSSSYHEETTQNWMTSLIFVIDSFYKYMIKLKLHKTLIILTCKSFCFLRIVIIIFERKHNEFGLKRENALLNVSLKNILNYHWIKHVKDPKAFEVLLRLCFDICAPPRKIIIKSNNQNQTWDH